VGQPCAIRVISVHRLARIAILRPLAALTRLTVILMLQHVLALFRSAVMQPQLAAKLAAAVCQAHVSVPLTPATVQERAGAQKEAEYLRSRANAVSEA